MSALQESRRKLFQVRPTNIGTNVWSFKEGNPQVEFQLKGAHVAIGKTLRLNGIFECVDSGDRKPSNNIPLTAKPVEKPSNVSIDSRIGLHSVIENITINSGNTNRNFELVKHYNRLVATLQPKATSQSSYINGGLDVNGLTSKAAQTGSLCNKQLSFSLPLHAGMLKENLDLKLLGGLNIIFDLAPDSFVLSDTNYTDVEDKTALNSSYRLKELVLTYDAIMPTGKALTAIQNNTSGSFNYTSFTSYFTSIVSADSNHIFNFNASLASSVLMNFIPSKWINNYSRNSSMATPLLNSASSIVGTPLTLKAKIKDVTYLRNNQKFPLDFSIPAKDLTTQTDNPNANLLFESINAVVVPPESTSALVSPVNVRGFGNVRPNSDYFATSNALGSQDPIFDLSIGYDHIQEMGVDMRQTPFGFRVRSTLTNGVDNPHSVFLFVKQMNTLTIQNGAISTRM